MPPVDLPRLGLGTYSDADREQWRENVAAIPKASSREHMEANLAAGDLDLDDDDRERIDAIDRRERVIDPSWAPWNR